MTGKFPIINYTDPFYLVCGLALFVLLIFLSNKSKKNTIPCIMLLCFLTILVGHTVESNFSTNLDQIRIISRNLILDELFVLGSFLVFLRLDHIQVTNGTSKKKTKKNGIGYIKGIDEKIIKDDGLDTLWKDV